MDGSEVLNSKRGPSPRETCLPQMTGEAKICKEHPVNCALILLVIHQEISDYSSAVSGEYRFPFVFGMFRILMSA